MKTLIPNDLGKKILVEECQRVNLKDFLKLYRNESKKIFLTTELEVSGLKIELATSNTSYNGVRYWFKCPVCGRRSGVLFKHPLSNKMGCRGCLGLEYRNRRYKGMIESN